MATQKQIEANRENAQRSTGPQTAEGKAIVSQNATKHGLLANQAVICDEDQADFDLHLYQWLEELKPEGSMESLLAQRIVILSWRLKRAARTQVETIDSMTADITPRQSTGGYTRSSRIAQYIAENPEPRPDFLLGKVAIKDIERYAVLDRLLMYERRIEHSLYKTIAEIHKLSLIRQMKNSETREANKRLQMLQQMCQPSTPACNPTEGVSSQTRSGTQID